MEEFKPILKDLNAVVSYATARYTNEFVLQEVQLNDTFKDAFRRYLRKKGGSIEYFNSTSVITTKMDQHIFIANQWFAIASYFVDFCTELLTYQQYFEMICDKMYISSKERLTYATRLKTCPTDLDKSRFVSIAYSIVSTKFSNHPDCKRAANYLWQFTSDYEWWHGSKTVNRHDFFISPVLNQMNVVNANSEFLAEIVHFYASDYNLRKLVEELDTFIINPQKKDYIPTSIEENLYNEAEFIPSYIPSKEHHGISISAASLERFQSSN
jgi:hypothetical protein